MGVPCLSIENIASAVNDRPLPALPPRSWAALNRPGFDSRPDLLGSPLFWFAQAKAAGARARRRGRVAAIGADVTKFPIGDGVFGIGKGSFAHYARARENKLVPKPITLTLDQAAFVAISGLTRRRGLLDAGRVQQGQHVLIIGASGGVLAEAADAMRYFAAEHA